MPVSAMPSAPPKITRPAATTAAKKAANESSAAQLLKDREEGVNGLFQIGQLACIMTGNWADAGAFETHGPNVSRETAQLGARYEKVGKSLDILSQVGPFTAIIGAVVPLILQIAANHNKIPADKVAGFGVVTPTILEAQQKMQMQQMEMQARAAQRRQEEAFRQEQAAFDQMMAEESVSA
jgi:hypothetical protein